MTELGVFSYELLSDETIALALAVVQMVVGRYRFDALAVFSAAGELEAWEASGGAHPLAPDVEDRYAVAMEAEWAASQACGVDVRIGVRRE
ncbi:MAG: hypothetical protein F9K32_20150 [Desulfobulbaceae bacterium]|nr:MAG: hypothetical protein F9K32_20150 [Desulfobulbaceae bacterium]